jgi:hypothetical protein
MVVPRRLRNLPEPPASPVLPTCALCDRPVVPGPSADEHHLVPRSQGGRDKTLIHRICHRKIHSVFSERELAERFNTWAALRAHPEIASFIRWVAGKPPTFYDNSRRMKRERLAD